jgi:hypothetical protein
MVTKAGFTRPRRLFEGDIENYLNNLNDVPVATSQYRALKIS